MELHRVSREFHVGLFEGRAVGAHLAERHMVGAESRHHSFGRKACDREHFLRGRGDLGPRIGEDAHRLRASWGAQADPVAGGGRDERGDAGVGDDLAAARDDEVVGGVLQLAHQVAGDEDGAAFGGEATEEGPHPGDALRVHAVERLVHHEDGRVAEQRRGDAEALPHAQRVAAGLPLGNVGEASQSEHLIDPPGGEALGVGQPEQVVAGASPGLERGRVEQRAEVAQRVPELPVGLAAD
jgi:hypothetical protein